jgi:hypothetical protein
MSIKNISLYIPHIFSNFTKEMVSKVFHDLEIGQVKNIDFVSKINNKGEIYNAAYIHFDHWYDTISASHFQARVLDPTKEARLMYDDPWFWIALENKARKFLPSDRKHRIAFDTTPVKNRKDETLVVPEKPVKPKKESWGEKTAMILDKVFREEETEMNQKMNAMMNEMNEIELDEQRMAELEDAMDLEDSQLIFIDGCYVQTMEQENNALRMQLAILQNNFNTLYQSWHSEVVKSQTLANAIQIMNQ